jgi:hypothetical protein
MSDKSNKYGYVGVDIPEQSFGSNKGVFNPAEINELVADNKWTSFGQLELIETQTYSSAVSFVDFTSIQESTYNVHFMTFSQMSGATDNRETICIRFYESGVLETASVYQFARQSAGLNPSVGFLEGKNTGTDKINTLFGSGTATGENDSGYAYFYNLGDSSKYSFATFQCVGLTNESYYQGSFGSAVLPQASTVDGIRILMNSGNYNDFKVSLYGIRYS